MSDLPAAVEAYAYMEKSLAGELDVTMIFSTQQDARDFAGTYYEHSIVKVRVTPIGIEHVTGHPRDDDDDGEA